MKRNLLLVCELIIFFATAYLVERFSLLYLGWGSVAGFFLVGYLSVIIGTSRYHVMKLKLNALKYLNLVLISIVVTINYQHSGLFSVNNYITLTVIFLIQASVYLGAWCWAKSLVAIPYQMSGNKVVA